VRTMPRRLAERGDPWAEIASAARPLAAARRRVEPLLAGGP
jgi:DNA primase